MKYNSMRRVKEAVALNKPDRVPLFLFLSTRAAKELDMNLDEYYSSPDNIVKAQLKVIKKFSNDCAYNFYYAAVEYEAFGGDIVFPERNSGVVNSGEPIIKTVEDIAKLKVPVISESKSLQNVLEVTRKLSKELKGEVPVVGVCIAPFALPIMQMGFDKYIDLIYSDFDAVLSLVKKNKQFTLNWAKAQKEAGADVIVYVNPLASYEILDSKMYRDLIFAHDIEVVKQIDTYVCSLMGSARIYDGFDMILDTGFDLTAFASDDNPDIIRKSRNKLALLGNLNANDMLNWSKEDAIRYTKETLDLYSKDGGFILSGNYAEFPYDIKDEILLAISDTVSKYGKYEK